MLPYKSWLRHRSGWWMLLLWQLLHCFSAADHIFGQIKTASGDRRPTQTICDIELAMQNSLQRAWPVVEIGGCYLHLCRAIWRKVARTWPCHYLSSRWTGRHLTSGENGSCTGIFANWRCPSSLWCSFWRCSGALRRGFLKSTYDLECFHNAFQAMFDGVHPNLLELYQGSGKGGSSTAWPPHTSLCWNLSSPAEKEVYKCKWPIKES